MPNENTEARRVRRGSLLLAALVLAAVLIFNLDVILDHARGYVDVVALVGEAPGVRVGSPVWVEGVEAGRVTAISFLGARDSARVALRLRLEERTRDVVRTNSEVYATRHRFIGEPLVVVAAGAPGRRPIEDGDTLRGMDLIDPFELARRGAALPASLDSIRAASAAIAAAVEERRPRLDELARRLDRATVAAAQLRDAFEDGTFAAFTPERVAARIDALRARVQELGAAAADALERYSPGAGGPLTTAIGDLRERSERLDRELATLESRIAAGDGILARMPQDSALQVAVGRVRAQIDSLTAEAASIGLRMLMP